MRNKIRRNAIRIIAALFACVLASLFLPIQTADAASSSIGVFVEPPPTTAPPPPATTPPTTEAPPSAATTTPPTTTLDDTSTTLATTSTIPSTTNDSLAAAIPPPSPTKAAGGFVNQMKSVAQTTRALVKGIFSGKPIADVVQDVLPAQVAAVVVPAVRTASTFAFPIGLAGAVFGFLGLQQRIDAGDPKLAAAPLAHDDEAVTFL